jgi:ABC-type transport system substrate-binding protein
MVMAKARAGKMASSRYIRTACTPTEAGFYQGHGPYKLKDWNFDYNLTLIKNPLLPVTAEALRARIDEIQDKLLDKSVALNDIKAGDLDISGIPSDDLDHIKFDPTYKYLIHQVVKLGTEFYCGRKI